MSVHTCGKTRSITRFSRIIVITTQQSTKRFKYFKLIIMDKKNVAFLNVMLQIVVIRNNIFRLSKLRKPKTKRFVKNVLKILYQIKQNIANI